MGQRGTLNLVQGGAVAQSQRVGGGGAIGTVPQAALLSDGVNQEHLAFIGLHLHAVLSPALHHCTHAVHEAVLFVRVS